MIKNNSPYSLSLAFFRKKNRGGFLLETFSQKIFLKNLKGKPEFSTPGHRLDHPHATKDLNELDYQNCIKQKIHLHGCRNQPI
jgi:hypothetical protein